MEGAPVSLVALKNGIIRMNKKPKNKTSTGFKRSRIAWLVSCQFAMLMGGAGMASAAEYFNPALLEIDNPAQGKAGSFCF